jgi:N6-L-threonylcarbamoyladenine synthase
LACSGHDSPARLPVSIDGLTVSFSGPESHAHRLLAGGHVPAAVAAGVELCIAESLAKLINTASKVTGIHDFIMVGGVTANSFIRRYITAAVGQDGANRLYFPAREYSPDNAVGAAFFALRS